MPREHLRSIVGDTAFEYEWDGEALVQNGKRIPLEVHPLGQDQYVVRLNGVNHTLVAEPNGTDGFLLRLSDGQRQVRVLDHRDILLEKLGFESGSEARQLNVLAPMPGLALHVLVEAGTVVSKGDGLVVLEAMKMENEIRAPFDGRIARVHVSAGDAVVKNATLVEYEG